MGLNTDSGVICGTVEDVGSAWEKVRDERRMSNAGEVFMLTDAQAT